LRAIPSCDRAHESVLLPWFRTSGSVRVWPLPHRHRRQPWSVSRHQGHTAKEVDQDLARPRGKTVDDERLAARVCPAPGRIIHVRRRRRSSAVAKVVEVLRTNSHITMLVNNAGGGATAPLLGSSPPPRVNSSFSSLRNGGIRTRRFPAAPSWTPPSSGHRRSR